MKKLLFILLFTTNLYAQEKPWSVRMADAFMQWHKDSIVIGNNKYTRWDYEQGLMLKALETVWVRTGEGKYLDYIQKEIDLFVEEDGNIRTYDLEEYNIDNITSGRNLLLL